MLLEVRLSLGATLSVGEALPVPWPFGLLDVGIVLILPLRMLGIVLMRLRTPFELLKFVHIE